jgi:5-methylcytosine-specific restriction endonuclease McrA
VSTAQKILDIVRTDRTFDRVEYRGRDVWAGKCLHCDSHLYVGLDGRPISRATIEHIVARAHGGTDDLENLGLACARCNHEKGRRWDTSPATDPRVAEIVEKLQRKRKKRWRDPD